MKINKQYLILAILIGLFTFSCSSEDNNETPIEPSFNAKKIKQVTNSDGYWQKFFYDDQNQIKLMTQTSNQITLDSTYFFYNNSTLSKTLNRIHVPSTGIVNTEIIFTQFTSSIAQGTYKIFLDDGTIFQDKTFEHTFSNELVKTITFLNLDGTKSSEKIYTHDENGNLTNWIENWYGSNNNISSTKEHTFSNWDTNGLKTQSLLYWNYRIDNIPNTYISNNNCLNRTENNELYNYSFEYDAEGNVTKYNSIDEQRFINLEYYE